MTRRWRSGWLEEYAAADAGVEGIVAKGAAQRYLPGRRAWVKLRSLGVGGVGLGLGVDGCEVSTDSGFLASWATAVVDANCSRH